MRQVIANVPKDPTAKDSCSNVPVVAEEEVGQVVERDGKDEKQRGWHDQSKLVHW